MSPTRRDRLAHRPEGRALRIRRRQHPVERQPRRARDGGRRARGAGRFRADVQDIDDASPPARFHARQGQAAEPDGGKKLELEIVLPIFVGGVGERAGTGRPRIVDQNVDFAQGGLRVGEGQSRGGGVHQIAGNRVHLTRTGRLDFRPRPIEYVLASRQYRDIAARIGEFKRDTLTNPLATTGNERRFAVQSDIHDRCP